MTTSINDSKLSAANLFEKSMEEKRNRLSLSILGGAAVSALIIGVNPYLKGNKLVSAGVALGTGAALAATVKYHPTIVNELPEDLMGTVNVGITSMGIANITGGIANYLTTSTETVEQEY